MSIAQVNLKLIWDVVSSIKVGQRGRAYVVDADGRLIAHPDISLVLRNTDMLRLAQVRSARAGPGARKVQEADDIAGHKVLTAYAPVNPLGWFVFVETPIEEAYAPLYASIQRTGFVLLGALALAFIAGMFLARRMVVPIQALRAGAARIGRGDLSQRIAIKTGDEVEGLADQFNDMAGKLQESYAGLEHKVEQRTHELSAALEQQTATAEVLSIISSRPANSNRCSKRCWQTQLGCANPRPEICFFTTAKTFVLRRCLAHRQIMPRRGARPGRFVICIQTCLSRS